MSENLKITDANSGESTEYEDCRACGGTGGFDASTDCEEYDDWQSCPDCDGRGCVEIGYFDREVFDPKRDAWTPND